MIISASRRTDIPAYYSEWFFNRIQEGYALVRNPMNPHYISRISLSPEVVDGIVFWTKNPVPMLERIDELQDYNYYFQFTLTSYGSDVEKNVPSKNDIIIPAFQRLSSRIGKERVVWRYDPILLSDRYTLEYHMEYFRRLCDRLADYTEKCTVSFLDLYKNIRRSIASLGIRTLSVEEIEELMESFAKTAKEHGISMDTCCEEVDLARYGIGHASCIDRCRLERISGSALAVERDQNQRGACACAASIDLGSYNTCRNGCVYCYANFNQTLVNMCCDQHDPSSALLYGEAAADDIIKPRQMKSYRVGQMNLFG